MKRHTIQKAVRQTIRVLRDNSTVKNMVDKNFQIAKKHHDVGILQREFETLVQYL
jgi:hypothetical protein